MPRLPRERLLQITLALVMVAALTVGAVGMRTAVSPRSNQAGDPAPAVLHWANEGISDLSTLDPARGPDYNALQAAQLIYGGLVRFGPNFQIVPDTAARWQVSPDNRIYTFYLRPDVRFGDGTPLRAADIAFSLNRILLPQFVNQSYASIISDIEGAGAVSAGHAATASGIQVLDSQTLRIRLRASSGSFLTRLATQAGYIVPPWRVNADPGGWDRHAFGTGPFMVSRWVPNNALLLAPNPYYYRGKLQIGGVEMPFIPEPLVAYKRYRAGALDIMGSIQFPTSALYEVEGQPDFHRSPILETLYLTLNTRYAPFKDARVRLAFAHALNKQALVQQVYSHFAHPTDGILPPGMLGYNPSLHGAGYDPALARTLLAAAGYPGGRGFPPLTFLVDEDAQYMGLATNLARQWRTALGVQVRLVQYKHTAYNLLLQQRAYQLAVIDWTRDYPDPQNFLSQLLHSGNANNNGGWSDQTFDQLVDRADNMRAADPTRIALYRHAEEIAMSQAAVIPLVNPFAGILLRQNVHGLHIVGGQVLATDWTQVRIAPDSGP